MMMGRGLLSSVLFSCLSKVILSTAKKSSLSSEVNQLNKFQCDLFVEIPEVQVVQE